MRRAATALALFVFLASCTEGATEPAVRVAFVQDLSGPDAEEHALPALQGAELAFALVAPPGLSVELVPVDLASDPAAMERVEADPSVVAAIVAPGVRELPEANVPLLSLSGQGRIEPVLRLVAPYRVLAEAIAGRLPAGRACVLSEDPAPDRLGALVAERLDDPVLRVVDPVRVLGVVREAGCADVVWVGGPDAGAIAARALASAGLRLVGGDRLLDPDFLPGAGPAAEGVEAVCSCTDVSTSTGRAARRFVQDYQAEYGSAPGSYAAEAWVASNLVLRALSEGGSSRADVGAWLAGAARGAGTSGFGTLGVRLEDAGSVHRYIVRGGRWAVAETT